MIRTIIHLDLDAFYCAVEERRNPTLQGRAFAVGGPVEGRGVVSSCSYTARRFGVRSAMPMGQALALCPHLICLRSDFAAYRAASVEVMTFLRSITPLVEQISIDEAFLDVSVLEETGAALAYRLQATISEKLGLSCSLGIAPSKLVAKIATDFGKAAVTTGAPPHALCEVPPGSEISFLSPLPTSALWGVGPKTAEKLAGLGIHTISDILRWPEGDLVRRFGEHGRDLARHARGVDDRPIITERAVKSISRETTYACSVTDGRSLWATLSEQAQQISRQLHQEELCGTTVRLKLRWPDFTTQTRQATRVDASDQQDIILAMGLRLLERSWSEGQPVRLIGLGVSGLEVPAQFSLWDTRPAREAEREKRVQTAIIAVESRLGAGTVWRGSELKK